MTCRRPTSYRTVGVALLAVIVSCCATRPVSDPETRPVPPDRIIDSRFLQASVGTGAITIKRDRGLGGSACSSRVFVDASPMADLRPSEKLVVYLPPGDHIISAWPNGICGGGMSEVRASVTSGAALTFRIGYGSNGDFFINPTAF
jgi:hypothetical protein